MAKGLATESRFTNTYFLILDTTSYHGEIKMDYTLKELAAISEMHNPGVSEEALKEAEKALGATFPPQYRDLMKLVNGPVFYDWRFFPVKDTLHPRETWDDIVQYNQSKQRPRFLLPDFVAFAESMNDYLCFKIVNGAMQENVYLHALETKTPEFIASDLRTALFEIISFEEEEEDLGHVREFDEET